LTLNYLSKENSDKNKETISRKQLTLEINGKDQTYKNGKQT